jgi:hypothetical protein
MLHSLCHLEEGEKELDNKLVKNFPQSARELLKRLYKPIKVFNTRFSKEYPTNMLRVPYQEALVMICMLHGELDAHKFKTTWIQLFYSFADTGSTFNLEYVLSFTLEEALTTKNHTTLGQSM